MDRKWAERRQWPKSMYLPSDHGKGVYLLESYHQLHCLLCKDRHPVLCFDVDELVLENSPQNLLGGRWASNFYVSSVKPHGALFWHATSGMSANLLCAFVLTAISLYNVTRTTRLSIPLEIRQLEMGKSIAVAIGIRFGSLQRSIRLATGIA